MHSSAAMNHRTSTTSAQRCLEQCFAQQLPCGIRPFMGQLSQQLDYTEQPASCRRSRRSCRRETLQPIRAAAAPAATDTVSVTQEGDANPGPRIPQHWEQQMKNAPLGKRRVLQRYYRQLERINGWEAQLSVLPDEALRAKTGDFKQRLASGTFIDDLLPEAFAVVREASRRILGMRHFDAQMVGGMALHDGQVAEMSTGEGKTLVATLPAYLNALTGHNVHVVTVNDYLAARDAEWMGKIFSFLGLTCAAVRSGMTIQEYKAAYGADITYVTGQELGFAYLRDNTAPTVHDLVLPPTLHYAVVDEADSILIDESRNPLIISLPADQNTKAIMLIDKIIRPMWEEVSLMAAQCADAIRHSYAKNWGERLTENVRQLMEKDIQQAAELVKSKYYKLDLKTRNLTLSQTAIQRVLEGLVAEGIRFSAADKAGRPPIPTDVFEDPMRWGQLTLTAFKAYEFYLLGKQYIVRDNRVIMINESTGRLLDITRWQEGLHQAIEAKEGVPVKDEMLPTATITFQVFFRFYNKLAGMTGTAAPATAEFYELYGLKVVQVPTHRPVQRVDLPCRFYFDPEQRAAALCRIVESCWARGRPVLIGTTSVQQSELVLSMLQAGTDAHLYHSQQLAIQVLNAKPEKVRMESQIVAQAGLPGSVTIATNMAGRGTDIILGGSAPDLTSLVLMKLVYRRLMSEAEQDMLPEVPQLLRSGPLGLYDHPDVTHAMSAVQQSTALGLPFEVHTALLGAMLLADVESTKQSNGQPPMSYEQARQLCSWVMTTADAVRREAYERIRDKFGGVAITDLQFSACVAPVLADVMMDWEGDWVDQPQGQVMALKAAVMLRGWLDGQCAQWGEAVRQEGGLLVIGMSMQESRRVELQLRGRAGRQGDPGTTIMMYDMYDPRVTERNFKGVFEMIRQMEASSSSAVPYMAGKAVDILMNSIQREAESYYSNSRVEMKRYDEVVEHYRRSVYSLRRLILSGTTQQCTQVLYMFIQAWVDQLVSTYFGSGNTQPHAWLKPSIPISSLPRELQYTTRTVSSDNTHSHSQNVDSNHSSQQSQELLTPLEVVIRHMEELVNPAGRVGGVQWDFKTVKDGAVKSESLRNVLTFLGVLEKQGPDDAQQSMLITPMETDAVTLFSPQQAADLALFISGQNQPGGLGGLLAGLLGRPSQATLSWPQPPMRLTAKQQLSVMTHARLYGMQFQTLDIQSQIQQQPSPNSQLQQQQQEQTSANMQTIQSSSQAPTTTSQQQQAQMIASSDMFTRITGLPASTAPGITQRPPVAGKHAYKVSAIRDYLGLVLIHTFEQRRVASVKALLAQGNFTTHIDAQQHAWTYERDVMLLWLDAVWSVFLEEVEALKRAVAVKTYSASNPLAEFQLDANKTFLGMLATFREAVVAKVIVPEIDILSPLNDEDMMMQPPLTSTQQPKTQTVDDWQTIQTDGKGTGQTAFDEYSSLNSYGSKSNGMHDSSDGQRLQDLNNVQPSAGPVTAAAHKG